MLGDRGAEILRCRGSGAVKALERDVLRVGLPDKETDKGGLSD
jgi:hypothetical protein